MKLKKSNVRKVPCPRDGCNGEAIIDPQYGVLPCAKCQAEDAQIQRPLAPQHYNLTKQHRIQEERDKHDGDILQPWAPGKDPKPNPDFVKAYPQMAKEYFTDEQLKKM